MRHTLMLCLTVSALSFTAIGPVWAQDADKDADRAKRVELATEMHKIRPAKAQVQDAVNQVGQNLPPMERDRFMKMVEKAFDYTKLEKLSIDTMADLYTVPELTKMVEYFGSAEARSIEKKLPTYQEKIQPEIIRMLDSAMIADRTGNAPAPEIAPKSEPVKPAPQSTPAPEVEKSTKTRP